MRTESNPMEPLQEEKTRLIHYLESFETEHCRISFCERFDEKSRIWNHRKHSHDCLELIYFLEGKASIIDSDRTMATSLFELVVYPAGVDHQEFLDTRYHQSIICLQLECASCGDYPHLFKLKDQQGMLRWVIKQLHAEYKNPGEYHDRILADLLNLLFDLIRKTAREFEKPSYGIADKCMQFIQEHFSEGIDMNRLAAATFVSTSYLNRVFRGRFGMTPIQYLNRYRMEVAREMLVQTDSKIAEIARYVGVEDAKHFSKLFKKITGRSPMEHRRQYGSARFSI